MVARDFTSNRITDPTPKDTDGNPTGPHIGATRTIPRVPHIEQSGFAQGGTTNPPEGWDGLSRQLDNDRNPSGQRSPKSTFDTFKSRDEVFPDDATMERTSLQGDASKPAKVDVEMEATVTDLTDTSASATATADSGDGGGSRRRGGRS